MCIWCSKHKARAHPLMAHVFPVVDRDERFAKTSSISVASPPAGNRSMIVRRIHVADIRHQCADLSAQATRVGF